MNRSRAIHILAGVLFIASILLFTINIIGLYHYTNINNDNSNTTDDRPRYLSEQEFWNDAYKIPGETTENYTRRLTALVSNRMLDIDPKFTKPTFFENYILWAFSRYLKYYEWQDTQKAVRLGGGFCSQHAIVFNNILRDQDIVSRILGLGGHVLNEVLIDDEWRVYDPDFNVVFETSLNDLESNPDKVYQAYRSVGKSEIKSGNLQDIFGSTMDNWHFKSSKDYAIARYLIEKSSLYLIWIIPMGLAFIGIAIILFDRTRHST